MEEIEKPKPEILELTKEKDWKHQSNDNLKKRNSTFRVINLKTCSLIIIFLIAGFGGLFYYLATNNFLSATLVDNSTCIMPDIPSCPANTCNCPAPLVNVSIPTINVRCVNSTD